MPAGLINWASYKSIYNKNKENSALRGKGISAKAGLIKVAVGEGHDSELRSFDLDMSTCTHCPPALAPVNSVVMGDGEKERGWRKNQGGKAMNENRKTWGNRALQGRWHTQPCFAL